MNYLVLTEGKRTEINIFSEILKRYGFHIVKREIINDYSSIATIDKQLLSNSKDNVIIAQAPRNRLRDLLKFYNEEQYDLDKIFGENSYYFNGIFLLFDVDHTSESDLNIIFNIHNDETEKGLLLVSSPCIEIMSEPRRKKTLQTAHLRSYKAERNIKIEKLYNTNTEQYIIDNFEKLSIYFLNKNVKDFNNKNVMEHPELVIEKINKENIRGEELVEYRYFTTVTYVLLAFVMNKTIKTNNYNAVKSMLKSNIKASL